MKVGFRKMAAKCSKSTTFLLLILFAHLLDSNAVHGGQRLSMEEDLELDQRLQLINKPAIKSLQTEYGDIVDCIDIYKQLAFDHPLLKNHEIQMKPKTIPKGMKDEGSRKDAFPAYVANISCPPGSVPIRRTTKEDLIIDKYQKSARRNYPTSKSWRVSPHPVKGLHYATMVFMGKTYGAKAALNIWQPAVSTYQFSRASILIANGSELLATGWEVRKSRGCRLYISFNVGGPKGFGCMNVVCPGFVQVHREVTIGTSLPSSTYNGRQYEIRIGLYQDHVTRNWWFIHRDRFIGYWPKELFENLATGGNGASWGGHVFGPMGELTPPMGSGHYSGEGYRKAAYLRGIKVISTKSQDFEAPDEIGTILHMNTPACYNAYYAKNPQWEQYMYFGGPKDCTLGY